jgi:hypothetical protein
MKSIEKALQAGLCRITPEGMRCLKVSRFTSAARSQRFMVVPCSLYGPESMYRDWVYQPYFDEHFLMASLELGNRLSIKPGVPVAEASGLVAIDLNKIPEPELSGLAAGRATDKMLVIGPLPTSLVVVSPFRRLRSQPWIGKALTRFLGTQQSFPEPNRQSVVCLVTPSEATAVHKVLLSYGFIEEDSTWVEVGPNDVLGKAEQRGLAVQSLIVANIWGLVGILVGNWFYTAYLTVLEDLAALEKLQAGGKENSNDS